MDNQVFEQMIDDDVDDEKYVQGNRLEMKTTKKRPRHQNAFPATANVMRGIFRYFNTCCPAWLLTLIRALDLNGLNECGQGVVRILFEDVIGEVGNRVVYSSFAFYIAPDYAVNYPNFRLQTQMSLP